MYISCHADAAYMTTCKPILPGLTAQAVSVTAKENQHSVSHEIPWHVAFSNMRFGQYHKVRQTHNDDQPDATAVHASQAVDVNIPGTPGSPNCVFWPLCVKLPTGLTTTAVPDVNTSSACRASSNVIGASSTVYPLDSASSSIDRRVIPGRMVPYIQPGRPQKNQLLGKA